ncbi:MAG: TIGR04255 family protein [Phycisphaerae bacterium]|nr:TIGR04255 family protein [Phycisphaerae bacterium]
MDSTTHTSTQNGHPLVEAVCELRFPGGGRWDWTIPGRLADALASEFPESESPTGTVIEQTSGDAQTFVLPLTPPLVRLRRRDHSAMVQVGQPLLAINHFLSGYSWPNFRSLILRVNEEHAKLVGSSPVVRRGLRYINRFLLSNPESTGEEFVSILPRLNSSSWVPIQSSYQRIELDRQSPTGRLVIQTALSVEPTGRSVVVDLDFGTASPLQVDELPLEKWLDAAHDCVKSAFGATLTYDVRQSLKLA